MKNDRKKELVAKIMAYGVSEGDADMAAEIIVLNRAIKAYAFESAGISDEAAAILAAAVTLA